MRFTECFPAMTDFSMDIHIRIHSHFSTLFLSVGYRAPFQISVPTLAQTWSYHPTNCTRARFSVLVSWSGELVTAPFLAKADCEARMGLFHCWSLMCDNNMATNLQMLASSYGRSRRFVARGCRTQTSWKVMQEDSEQWNRQRKIVVGVQNARFQARNSVLLGTPLRKSRNDWIC